MAACKTTPAAAGTPCKDWLESGSPSSTADDLLLRTVGRSGVEAQLDEAPVLSTRELFALKNQPNAAPLPQYRRGALTMALDAGWHVSARRLCATMNSVAALPLTRLNPGVADPADFSASASGVAKGACST